MRHQRCLAILLLALGSLLLSAPRPSRAQGIFAPWFRVAELFDEKRLELDQARLQTDIARGNTARINRDLEQIQRDQWWLEVDRRGRMFGPAPPLPQPTGLSAAFIPQPQYPGFGYAPPNPAQAYAPAEPAPAPVPTSAGGTGSQPTATPPSSMSVVIRNPEDTRTAVNYVVDGISYHTESGGFQRLAVGPSSTIVYDRGGDFGVRRYALSTGEYEFRASDTGWALFKRPAR